MLETHYYHCESCEAVDICTQCFRAEKQKNEGPTPVVPAAVVTKHSTTETTSAIQKWLSLHQIANQDLCDALSSYLTYTNTLRGRHLDLQGLLSQTSRLTFDRLVRRVRVDALSKLREQYALQRIRADLDVLLLRFERIWRKSVERNCI